MGPSHRPCLGLALILLATGVAAEPVNQAPTITVPSTIKSHAGCGFRIGAVVRDVAGDSVSVRITGLPEPLTLDVVQVSPGFAVAAILGLVPPEQAGRSFELRWSVEDLHGGSASARTRLVVEPADSSGPGLEAKVKRLVHGRSHHGIPSVGSRELGPRAAPILEDIFRDPNEKRYWRQAVIALAFIGLPESYESLRSFVWTRFTGPVDNDTFRALLGAQSALGALSGSRPDVIDSLIQSTNPDTWASLPWSFGDYTGRKLGIEMAGASIYALSTIADGRAVAELERLDRNPGELEDYLTDARERRALVLEHGWIRARELKQAQGGLKLQ